MTNELSDLPERDEDSQVTDPQIHELSLIHI